MPTYSFECPCGGQVTVLISHQELAAKKKRPPKCPKCGGKTEFKFPGPKGRVTP